MRRAILPAILCLLSLPAWAAPDPRVKRGIDIFAEGPSTARSGTAFPLEIMAYGFPEVTTLIPLSGARVEARWDPESIGSDEPPILGTTGADGRSVLLVPMPEGPSGSFSLLLSITAGGRSRTHTLSIARSQESALSIAVSEREVVPGGRVIAWVSAEDPITRAPLSKARVEVELREGGLARVKRELLTDEVGSAVVELPVPITDEIAWSFVIWARLVDGKNRGASASTSLRIRTETPSKPSLHVAFDQAQILAGTNVAARIRIQDASQRPLSGAPLRYWLGPRGAEPKDEFEKRSLLRYTGASGELVLTATAPTTVPSHGAAIVLIVEAEHDGYDLRESATVQVGALSPSLDLIPEGGLVTPGITQRLLLRAEDAQGAPIRGPFTLEGDHLNASVITDVHGEAEFSWNVPSSLGADHPNGPCAGWVAATVTIRPEGKIKDAFGHERLSRCLKITDNPLLVVPERPTVRAGEKLKLEVLGAKGRRYSLLAMDHGRPWPIVSLEGGRGEVRVPSDASGTIDLDVFSADTKGGVHTGSGHLLVIPRVLPKLVVKKVGGRLAPGGEVILDVHLEDERGRGIPGSVSGHAIDRFGGGRSSVIWQDTRRALTAPLDLGSEAEERRDAYFSEDRSLDGWRRAAMANLAGAALTPFLDPAKDADERFLSVFASIVRSLEGAVFESTAAPDKLENARRKVPSGYELNPELLTLVTDAMGELPETPGGERIELQDLVAIDGAVRFDPVARRVTRLKLFRVLEAVREHVYAKRLYPDEMALKEPGSILRRLVREGTLDPSSLLDPWGGTIQFVRSEASDVPYLAIVRHFRLVSPGPDGKVGTADDVTDPFERVLKSGSPYAKAVEEDRLVDARYEVVVGDETVAAWKNLFEELTGSVMGAVAGLGGIGTHGYGAGGGGVGSASGSGGLGRVSFGSAVPVGILIPPARTDAQGNLQIRLKLPDLETTYSIGLVGRPDDGPPAATEVEVNAMLPLSVRVEAGTQWSEHDALAAEVIARNRSDLPVRAALSFAASGALALDQHAGQASVDIPARGSTRLLLPLRAAGIGAGLVEVSISAPGMPDDRVRHQLEVRREAERQERWVARWSNRETTLSLPPLAEGEDPAGLVSVEVERGVGAMMERGLRSLDPDRLGSLEAEVEALAAARAALAYAERAQPSLRSTAERTIELALGRALGFRGIRAGKKPDLVDARIYALAKERAATVVAPPPKCPPETADPIAVLESEPRPDKTGVLACWDVAVGRAVSALDKADDPARIGRGILALLERSHRKSFASQLADRLRERWLSADRLELRLPTGAQRATRAEMLAASFAARGVGTVPGMAPDRLLAGLAELQDPSGSFGDNVATRMAMQALASADPLERGELTARIDGGGALWLELPIGLGGLGRLWLPRETASADVLTSGPAMARIRQPIWRSWWRKLPEDAPFSVSADWPVRAEVGKKSLLRLSLHHAWSSAESIEVRLPLPPGAHLAQESPGATELGGVLVIETSVPPSAAPTVLELPLVFRLRGQITAPEGRARALDGDGPRVPVAASRIRVGVAEAPRELPPPPRF